MAYSYCYSGPCTNMRKVCRDSAAMTLGLLASYGQLSYKFSCRYSLRNFGQIVVTSPHHYLPVQRKHRSSVTGGYCWQSWGQSWSVLWKLCCCFIASHHVRSKSEIAYWHRLEAERGRLLYINFQTRFLSIHVFLNGVDLNNWIFLVNRLGSLTNQFRGEEKETETKDFRVRLYRQRLFVIEIFERVLY